MRNLLIVDVETTGLDPKRDVVVEYGAILYSVEHQTTITQVSSIQHADANPCEAINRVPAVATREFDQESKLSRAGFLLFQYMAASAEIVVAHNAEFDRAFFPALELDWICTCHDFQWPIPSNNNSLVAIALAHGIGVSSAHRALTDCQLIAALFDRMTDLPGMLARAMRPKATFRAMVSYDDRELAKAAGFRWNGETKQWTRRMAIDDAASLGFKVVQCEGES